MTRGDSRGRRPSHADIDTFFGESKDRKRSDRKDRQLCGQVRRALSVALDADFLDPLLQALWIVDVEPAPTLARLRVWVAGPAGSDAMLILQRLEAVSGMLRAEVAQAIHRKQVPALCFAIHAGSPETEVDE
jgi:ribosome-binding factor A